jgi:Dimerisation domain
MPKNTPRPTAPHEQILAMIVGFWQSRALAVATELELADLIAQKPLHVDILAAQTKSHSPSLFRLLRALESLGIFMQVSPMVFANTSQSECLRKNVPHSLSAFVRAELSTGGGLYEAWAGLGGASERAKKPSIRSTGMTSGSFADATRTLERFSTKQWAKYGEELR